MKKILSLLTAITLTTSGASSVISCSSITGRNSTKEANIENGTAVVDDMVSKISKVDGSSFTFDSSKIKDVYSWIMSKTVLVPGTTNEYTYKSNILKNYIKNLIFAKAGIKSSSTNLKLVTIITKSSDNNPAIVFGKKQSFNLTIYDTKKEKTTSFNFSFIMNRSSKQETFADLKTKLKDKTYDLNNFQFANKKSDFNFYADSGSKKFDGKQGIISEINNSIAYSSITSDHITFNQFHDLDKLVEAGLINHGWHVGYNTITVNSDDKKQNFTFSVYAHWSYGSYNAYLNSAHSLGAFWSQSNLLLPNSDLNKKITSDDVLKDTKTALSTQKFNIFGKETALMNQTDANRIVANNTKLTNNTFEMKNEAATLMNNSLKVQTYFETTSTTKDVTVGFLSHIIYTNDNIVTALKDQVFNLDASFVGKVPNQALSAVKQEILKKGLLTKEETQYLSLSNSSTKALKSQTQNKVQLTIKNSKTSKFAETTIIIALPISAGDYAKKMEGMNAFTVRVLNIDTTDATSDWAAKDNPTTKYSDKIKNALIKYANSINIPGSVSSTIQINKNIDLNNGDNIVPMQLTYAGETATFNIHVIFINGQANHSGFHARHSGDYHYLDVDISHYACLRMSNSTNNTFYNYLFYKSADWKFPNQDDTYKWLDNTSGSLDTDISDWFTNNISSDNTYVKSVWQLKPSDSLAGKAREAAAAYNGTGSLRLMIVGIWSGGYNKVGVGTRIVNPNESLLDNKTDNS